MLREFIPQSVQSFLSGYRLETFRKDLIAGLTVGVIALPLAMAFAISSGTTPDRGLFTAIVAGFLISALGGSRVQIGGPTGAFVVIVYGVIQRTGYEGLAFATLIASLLLILMGLFRIGSWIKYVPHSLITGFTTAIALLIFSSQIKDFFGLPIDFNPPHFLDKWRAYTLHFSSLHWPTFSLGFATLGFIVALRKWAPQWPWGILAIATATLLSSGFGLPVETIYSKFGAIPSQLPLPTLPALQIPEGRLLELISDALAIAFLAGIESLLSALIADKMIGSRHQPNCELVGQGIANLGSILFGGIPATGAIARTVANIRSGAQTPMAGMIHAIALFLLIFCFSPLVSQIPLAALASVLIMVSWNMSEWPHFLRFLRMANGETFVLLAGFGLTLFVDITSAICGGMLLSGLLSFIRKRRAPINEE